MFFAPAGPVVRVAAVVALAGLAATTMAQSATTRLQYQVSPDGINWSSSLDVGPGASVQVRALVSYVGSGTVAGLGQVIFQPVVSNWTAADTLLTTPATPGGFGVGPLGGARSTPPGFVQDQPGVWGRITPFAATAYTTSTYLRGFTGTGSASGLMRIGRADVTNWIGEGPTSGTGAANNWNGGGGVAVGQISEVFRVSTDPAFDTRTQSIVVFKFGFTVSSSTAERVLGITTPAAGIGRVTNPGPSYGQQNAEWYVNSNDTTPSIFGDVDVIGASVRAVPGPGVLGLVGMGILGFCRRRR
ncbi:MAG: PEP-CTERM sorting domain-containing protein [Phycisphaerales bacterium]|jgi:hypothetical protein